MFSTRRHGFPLLSGAPYGPCLLSSLLAATLGCGTDVLRSLDEQEPAAIDEPRAEPNLEDPDPEPPSCTLGDSCAGTWSFVHRVEGVCGVSQGETLTEEPELDVLYLVDTTGSMGHAISSLQDHLVELFGATEAMTGSARYAVASFEDFPLEAMGDPVDRAYELHLPLSSDREAIIAAIDGLTDADGEPIGHGGDAPETGYEALYQAATGAGCDANVDGDLDDSEAGDLPATPVGWRPGSRRVVVLVSDAPFRDPDRGDPAPAGAHGRGETIAALQQAQIQIVNVAATPFADCICIGPDEVCEGACVDRGSVPDMVAVAQATGSLAPDGIDVDGDGALGGPSDLADGDPVVFVVKLGSGGATVTVDGEEVIDVENIASYIVPGLNTLVLTDRIRIRLTGTDVGLVNTQFEPPYYDRVEAGTTVCFDATLTGSFPDSEPPRELSLGLDVVQAGALLQQRDISFVPVPR
jgi:hypothetical protein